MLVFATQSLPFWHQESMPKSCFFKTPSWTSFFFIYVDSHRKAKILGPLQNNPPTPTSVRRCQTRECRISKNGQNLSLVVQSGLWFASTAIPGDPTCHQKSDFFDLLDHLLPAPKKRQENKLAKIHQNLKQSHLGRPRLQFWYLFGAIWTSIFDNCSFPPKSLNLQHV